MRNLEGIATDYIKALREVLNLADRGLMTVRVTFPDGCALTVHGALNRFHLWRYVNAEEREHSLGGWQ